MLVEGRGKEGAGIVIEESVVCVFVCGCAILEREQWLSSLGRGEEDERHSQEV